MIQLHNVSVTYQQDVCALSGVSLMIPRGDFVFLTGASGVSHLDKKISDTNRMKFLSLMLYL